MLPEGPSTSQIYLILYYVPLNTSRNQIHKISIFPFDGTLRFRKVCYFIIPAPENSHSSPVEWPNRFFHVTKRLQEDSVIRRGIDYFVWTTMRSVYEKHACTPVCVHM